jgi:hypothetical protein
MINMTDISHTETETPGLEMDKNIFLNKLSEPDRTNIVAFQNCFENILKKKGQKGMILVVGGILSKQLPRKDIDIRVIFESDGREQDYKNSLEHADEKFEKLKELSTELTKYIPELKSTKMVSPTMDHEFENPSILQHEGSVTLEKPGATPIELLNTLSDSSENIIGKQKDVFCVITKI